MTASGGWLHLPVRTGIMTTLYRGRSESQKPIYFLVVDALELMVIEQPAGTAASEGATFLYIIVPSGTGPDRICQFFSYHKQFVENELQFSVFHSAN
jgi:hypothetical protein